MAITPFSFLRGQYNYNLFIGIDEDGNSVDYIDRIELDEVENLPVRYFPEETRIKRDTITGKGGVEYIETTYIKALINPNGKPVAKTGEKIVFRTNKEDIKFFIAGLGLPIMRSSNNGFFRSPMGFNETKLFDSITGAELTYTLEQMQAPPTFTYYDSDTTNPQ